MEVPPPFAILQASRGARGGEKPGRRSLEGLEESWDFGSNFGVSTFQTRSLFSITWEPGSGWACLDQFLADQVEREETT